MARVLCSPQPLGSVGTGADRTEPLRGRASLKVHGRGVFQKQHRVRALADALPAGLVMTFQQAGKIQFRMIKEPIGRLGLGGITTTLRKR